MTDAPARTEPSRAPDAPPILERSFVVIDRVGERTERRIWEQGVSHWDEFLDRTTVGPFGRDRKSQADHELGMAKEALARRDVPALAARLGTRHLWRLYPSFGDDAAFVDIETTGLSRMSAITVVGVLRAGRFHNLVRFRDLDRRSLAGALEGARMLVTYNGAGFDLPMLRLHHPVGALDLPHLDLRFAARRVGLRGGLKHVERELGLLRDREFAMMTGNDAVRLWHLWERKGNARALELLLRYNEADVVNMRTVAREVCARLERALASPGGDGAILIRRQDIST